MIFKKRKTYKRNKKNKKILFILKNFKFFSFFLFSIFLFFSLLFYSIFRYIDYSNIDSKYKDIVKEKEKIILKNKEIRKQLEFLDTKVGEQGAVLEFFPKKRPGERVVEVID